MAELGKLQRVSLKDVWREDERQFAGWLAGEETLSLLSKALDMELDLEETNYRAGSLAVDLICVERSSGRKVVIKRNLSESDHSDLGRMLAEVAGLEAMTSVWIAESIKDEHRATLDWLNRVTGKDVSFYGVEMELWRIGGSPVAPRFHVVSRPNMWSKDIAGEETSLDSDFDASDIQIRYWHEFNAYIEDNSLLLHVRRIDTKPWVPVSAGSSYFELSAFVNFINKRVGFGATLTGNDARKHFELLKKDKEQIENEVGCELIFRGKERGGEWLVKARNSDMDPNNYNGWPNQHDWLCSKLENMQLALKGRLGRRPRRSSSRRNRAS